MFIVKLWAQSNKFFEEKNSPKINWNSYTISLLCISYFLNGFQNSPMKFCNDSKLVNGWKIDYDPPLININLVKFALLLKVCFLFVFTYFLIFRAFSLFFIII